MGTGKPPEENLFYEFMAPCSKHTQGTHSEITLPKVRPGQALGPVITAASSYVIIGIILSLEKDLHRHITFYFVLISGIPELKHWSEIQERCCFSGLKMIFGLVITCFLSLDMSMNRSFIMIYLEAECNTAIY